MGLWRALAALVWPGLLSLLLSSQASAQSDPLQKARAALKDGDLAAADKAYSEIHAGTSEWEARLGDSWRYQFLAGHYNEAWRFSELALRTGVELQHLGYMRILSELKARVCTLPQEPPEADWRRLLAAHIYRFGPRYQASNYRADPLRDAVNGPLTQHLAPLELHYMADIPRSVLLPGTGCRWYSGRLSDIDAARLHEFAELYAWFSSEWHLPSTQRLPGYEAVEMRLFELGTALKEDDLIHDLLEFYTGLKEPDWLRLPEPERRFIWQKLVLAGAFPKPPYAEGKDGKAELVAAIVQHSDTTDAAEWMGLLDPTAMKAASKEKLYAHLLSIQGMPNQPYLLIEQARGAYQRGDVPVALGLIRRLLLLEESEGDSEIEAAAALLAARIFAEYSYDDAILAAVQNTLPSGTWGAIFRRQMLVQALTGNSAGYDKLSHMVTTTRQGRAVRLTDEQLAVLAAMAHRQGGVYATATKRLAGNGRLAGANLTFLADLGAEVVGLSPAERERVQPYLHTLAEMVRLQVGRGQNQKTLLELIRLYDGDATDAYAEGGETVREGTVNVGVADLTRGPLLVYPFHWSPPTHLPLRDLLVVPSDAVGRAWQIR